VWPTPSKPEGAVLAPGQQSVRPGGIGLLAAAVRSLPVPVFALGGLDGPGRAAECAAVGARAACLRGVLGAADPERAVRDFLDAAAARARG
jgi:thiamine monophosphate synthase